MQKRANKVPRTLYATTSSSSWTPPKAGVRQGCVDLAVSSTTSRPVLGVGWISISDHLGRAMPSSGGVMSEILVPTQPSGERLERLSIKGRACGTHTNGALFPVLSNSNCWTVILLKPQIEGPRKEETASRSFAVPSKHRPSGPFSSVEPPIQPHLLHLLSSPLRGLFVFFVPLCARLISDSLSHRKLRRYCRGLTSAPFRGRSSAANVGCCDSDFAGQRVSLARGVVAFRRRQPAQETVSERTSIGDDTPPTK
ncbi:hypothetical protein B0T10DRAFT_475245 [Thelonectria olida]|uniref:Uncharacterized protein n=1 Tax=Thelonectria olida TaxID=1576542 RepID=A0A9P8WEG1_9HYPO|nr:hypothetical protein B0T10DRAFT_475245 [Thelonectria olida]